MTEPSPHAADVSATSLGDAFTRQVFDALPANIAVIDREGVVRAVNPKWEEFALEKEGNLPGIGVGVNYLKVCARAARGGDEDGAKALKGIEAVLDGVVEHFSFEYPCDSPTERRWFLMSVVPLHGDPIEGAVVAHVDVSERRLAEERLRASEERFRLATEAAGMFAWEGNLVTGTAQWSENAATLIGCRPEDLPSRLADSAFFIAPEDRERISEDFTHAVAVRRITYSNEYRAISPLGTAKFFRSDTRVLYGDDGVPLRILGVTQDITERKIAEETLRESEDRFRALADNISQLTWMADETGFVFWYNRRWYEYTGTSLERMRGWGWRTVHHPDHLGRVVASWKRSLETSAPWDETFPLRAKDGQYRWFLSRALPIRDEVGRVIRWFGTNTDITEQRAAEEEAEEERLRSRRFSFWG
jgi:PAS domain S-box-containing protein